MQGAQLGFKPKSKRQSGAGLIQGPGTGTSDDIQKDIPVGSFIMPADSTQAIGADALAGMGSAVPANVSNGEFELPPEQVHAIGAQVLEQMRAQTHAPTGQPRTDGKELFFADGGLVDDERRRSQSRQAGPGTMYSNSRGDTARGFMPSASRAVVPAGPVTSGSRSSVPAVSPAGSIADMSSGLQGGQRATRPGPGTMYSNTRGETARGFMPSGSRAVVPSGPLMSGSTSMVPAGPVVSQPQPEGLDADARERVRQRVRGDTAAWQAERAAQDARFAGASAQPADSAPAPARGFMGRALRAAGPVGAVASAIPEARDVANVAGADDSTGLDVATQASEGIARVAGSGAGAALGAKAGGAIGAFGGPFAPITVPAGALIGAGVGGYFGNRLTDGVIDVGRRATGQDAASPVDRLSPSAPVRQPAPTQPVAQAAGFQPGVQAPAAPAAQQPAQQPVAPSNNIIREGNSFSAAGPITAGFTVNGEPADQAARGETSEQNRQAVANLMARTPELGAPRGFAPGQRDVLQDQLDRLESSNPNYLTIVRDSTEGGMRGFMNRQLNERDAQQRAERAEQRQQQITDLRRDIDSREYARGRDAVADERADLADSIAARQADLQLSQGERLDALYRDYEAATSENERARLAERIRVLSGNAGSGENLRNYYLPVGGGQEFDPESGTLRNVPQRLIDLRTGQEVGGSQPQAPQPLPPRNQLRVGQVYQTARGPARWDGEKFIPAGN